MVGILWVGLPMLMPQGLLGDVLIGGIAFGPANIAARTSLKKQDEIWGNNQDRYCNCICTDK